MDEEPQEQEEEERERVKISLPIILFGFVAFPIMDVIGDVPGADYIEEIPAWIAFFFQWMFGFEDVVLILQGLVNVVKLIPILQILPFWTLGWGLTCWIQNSDSDTAKQARTAIIAAAGTATIEGGASAGGEGPAGMEPGPLAGPAGEESAPPEHEPTAAAAAPAGSARQEASRESASRGESGTAAEIPGELPSTEQEGEKRAENEDLDRVMQPEAERSPMEVEKEKLFGPDNLVQFPRPKTGEEGDDSADRRRAA